MKSDLITKASELLQSEVRPHAWWLVFLSFLIFISLGPVAFNITLTGDEWDTVLNPERYFNWWVSIGRWGPALHTKILPFHSYNPAFLILGTALVAMGVGLWGARTIGFKSAWSLTAFAGLFVVSPFWSESIFFIQTQWNRVFFLVAAMIQCWSLFKVCEARSLKSALWPHGAVSVLAFVFAASLYQTSVVYALEFFGLALLYRLLQDPQRFPVRRLLVNYVLRALMVYLVALAIYGLSVPFFQWIFDVEPTHLAGYSASQQLAGLPDRLPERVWYLVQVLYHVYFTEIHMMPALYGWSILLGMGLFAIGLIQRIMQLQSGRVVLVSLVLLGMGFLLVLPFSFGILRDLRLNMTTSASILLAFSIAYPLERLNPGPFRSFYALLGAFLLVLSGYQLNSAAVAKQLNMQLDMYYVSEFVSQARNEKSLADISQSEKLVVNVYGRLDYGKKAPFATGIAREPLGNSTINCGIFNCQVNRLQPAVRLFGYNRPLSVKEFSRTNALEWIENNVPSSEFDRIMRDGLTNWATSPNEGLIIGRGPEVLLILSDLKP